MNKADKNACPHRVCVTSWSHFLLDDTVTALSGLWDEDFGKAASIAREMTENTVQSDGVLYLFGDTQSFCSKCDSYV